MMRTRLSMLVGLLILVLGVGLVLPRPQAMADDTCNMQTPITPLQEDSEIEGTATLCANAKEVAAPSRRRTCSPATPIPSGSYILTIPPNAAAALESAEMRTSAATTP